MAAFDDSDIDPAHAADVALARACARGDEAAIAEFEKTYGADLDGALRKSPSLGMQPADFRQLVMAKLFVAAEGEAPRIASYAGRGPLKGFVRVVVARMVVDIARAQDPERPAGAGDEALFDKVPAQGDPELAYLRTASRGELGDAMKRAFAKLTVRQRNLLRQRFLFDMAADRIASLYGVHRATAFTWIEEARRELVANVRMELGGSKTKGRELESLLAILGSRLDVSLRGVIGETLEDV